MPGELDCSEKVDSHDTLVDTQLGFNSSPPANKSAKYQMSTNKYLKMNVFFWPEQPESEPGWSPKHGTKLGPGLKLNNFRSATLALIEVLILIVFELVNTQFT